MVRDAFYYFRRAAEMRGGGFEGDDVDPRADAVDVSLVRRVPQGCGVSHVSLRRHEELEGDVLGPDGGGDHAVGLVEGGDFGAEGAGAALDVLHGGELGAGGGRDGVGG